MAEHVKNVEYVVEDVESEEERKPRKFRKWIKKYAKPLAIGVLTGMVTKGVTSRMRMNRYIYGVKEYSRGFNDGAEQARNLLEIKND